MKFLLILTLLATTSQAANRPDIDGIYLRVFQTNDGLYHRAGYWDQHGIWRPGQVSATQGVVTPKTVKISKPIPVQTLPPQ